MPRLHRRLHFRFISRVSFVSYRIWSPARREASLLRKKKRKDRVSNCLPLASPDIESWLLHDAPLAQLSFISFTYLKITEHLGWDSPSSALIVFSSSRVLDLKISSQKLRVLISESHPWIVTLVVQSGFHTMLVNRTPIRSKWKSMRVSLKITHLENLKKMVEEIASLI